MDWSPQKMTTNHGIFHANLIKYSHRWARRIVHIAIFYSGPSSLIFSNLIVAERGILYWYLPLFQIIFIVPSLSFWRTTEKLISMSFWRECLSYVLYAICVLQMIIKYDKYLYKKWHTIIDNEYWHILTQAVKAYATRAMHHWPRSCQRVCHSKEQIDFMIS